jgi:hypothetical protein
VWLKRPYNDKADVYSFAIIAYELLHRYQMISATDGSLEECQVYARRVAQAGWRPPLDESLPKPLKSVLEKCWAPEPESRPKMADVVTMLQEIMKSVDWRAIDGPDPADKKEEPINASHPTNASHEPNANAAPQTSGCGCIVC